MLLVVFWSVVVSCLFFVYAVSVIYSGSARNAWGRLYETCPLLKPRRSPTPAPPNVSCLCAFSSAFIAADQPPRPTHVPPQMLSSPQYSYGLCAVLMSRSGP
ncbi:unnamed protein product, partial [Ectocarpus sp. 8 AP-2014]